MRSAGVLALLFSLLAAGGAGAQTADNIRETRMATPTAWGDTGLWFVPTGEVLPKGGASFSVARTESDFSQGFTDVSSWPITGGVGIGGRFEAFGAMNVVTRIDRDTRPLFSTGTEPGGVVNEFPRAVESWSGNKLGDLYIGGKGSLLAEGARQPFALALRGTMKIPTADDEVGAGTGKADWFLDAIASKDVGRGVELSGFGGYAWRGDPDDFNLSDGFRWGIGAGMPSRKNVRFTAELYGELFADDNVLTSPGTVIGEDGSSAPALSTNENTTNLALSLRWQAHSGMFFDAGIVYAFGLEKRSEFGTGQEDESRDAIGFQFRLGWHRGVKIYVAPPPPVAAAPAAAPAPAPAAAPAPAPRPNGIPTVAALCDPCDVESGSTVAIRANGQDPDGDSLRIRWSTPTGNVTDATAANTTWRAPDRPGPVTVMVNVDDGRGGTASSTVTINVRERPVATAGIAVTFEDVHFDFDRYTLRPEGMAILDTVVKSLSNSPTTRIQIEGHTDSVGTSEYNLQLGERRAASVREYLTSHGISADRLTTVSFGEERPATTNETTGGRATNRRGVLTVRTQP